MKRVREMFPIRAVVIEGGLEITYEGLSSIILSDWSPEEKIFRGVLGEKKIILQVENMGTGYNLWGKGAFVETSVQTRRASELMASMPEIRKERNGGRLVSPMPGKVVNVFVEKGQKVSVGDSLVIIDAMKMENLLCAESDGIVGEVHVAAGDSLSVEQIIMEIAAVADN